MSLGRTTGRRTHPRGWCWSALVGATLVASVACNHDDPSPPTQADEGSTRAEETAASSSSGFVPLCLPDEARCNGIDLEICAPTGLEWTVYPCGDNARCCDEGDLCIEPRCLGVCDLNPTLPSSAGCAFTADRGSHQYPEQADGVVLGNPNAEGIANVQVFYIPEGSRDELPYEPMPEFTLLPGEVTMEGIELRTDFLAGTDSILRTGGIFRIYSDLPIVAYQHSPLEANRGNESSLLLPDSVLGSRYVASSFAAHLAADRQGGTRYFAPSYFTVVALRDDTTVSWTPKNWGTGGNGVPIPAIGIGETGTLRINRFDTLRIVSSDNDLPEGAQGRRIRDVSGTLIEADGPIWVFSGVYQTQIPAGD